jgi:hypothetical protein
VDNLEEMNIFVGTCNLPKLNHEEIQNVNRPITLKKTKPVVKYLPTTTEKPRIRWFLW